MSNIQGGKVLATIDDVYRLVYHEDGPNAGHVVAWNRSIFDSVISDSAEPVVTNAWKSVDYGTPQEADEVLPGLRSQIENL